MTAPTRRRIVTILSVTVLAVVLGGVLIGFTNRQHIQDVIAAAQFKPSSELQDIMEQIELTDYADTVFRATAPTLESSTIFAKQCAQVIHSDNDKSGGR